MARFDSRASHWIPANHQCRIPGRWVAFDTESKRDNYGHGEHQSWRVGAAYRWRFGLRGGDYAEHGTFWEPERFWAWVTEFCRPEQRTVVFAHNLAHDVRIGDAMRILPELGWSLEWCNLDRNVSTMTWRGDRGTLVLADLYTWLPMPLVDIGRLLGVEKLPMPHSEDSRGKWSRYCLRDAEVVYRAVSELVGFIRLYELGNWQPTGAGMSYATWRHKFLDHKVLVHDDDQAVAAERSAMHTGRAEAWRHGVLERDTWTEVDLKNAYTRIAADTSLPLKLREHTGKLSLYRYRDLRSRFACLVRVRVRTEVPCVPAYIRGRTIWPVGDFETWLWDCELDLLLSEGGHAEVHECYLYTKGTALARWADWILDVQHSEDETVSPVVRKWAKHSGRALIGRLSLRTAQWEEWGSNPGGEAGISYMVEAGKSGTTRMMHVGDKTFVETERREGRDSLPQMTGYIMAECRVRLWRGMRAAGVENVAHVDTDGLWVNGAGLELMRMRIGQDFERDWAVKHVSRDMTVYAPRNYRTEQGRKLAGVPKKATEVSENRFTGELWTSMSAALKERAGGTVTVTLKHWAVNVKDPRRVDSPGAVGRTEAIRVQSSNSSSGFEDDSTGV
jgi:hypothetical protein